MAAPLKSFFDSTTEEWFNHTLENKLEVYLHQHQACTEVKKLL